ncbi:TlpA family protein disulfide reductase [Pedobacter cryoconitis]|uniref:Thiol-disulfide isomerase/thioredoxin n=1 Tax=Pedobacter cryoconitis TaxID=188932 RepID=A0A7X0MJ64_9SPHI|nr:TlpA disulfide reductase family protein [Pedobacter cryoconitis]MBB6499143.1 thiol-disulfide isomerase/thioredoxin [Pedobacter cryoconitis]
MKKTISVIAMATLCLFFSAKSQNNPAENPTSEPVKIGDRIPDVTLTNLYNYKTTKTNLSDFKAKLIIIDFWATWCGSCVKNFPKMEELQKQYAGEVQFLKVTNQPKELVLPFLEKFHKGWLSAIPVVTDDQKLHQLFPHHSIPYYVWLDQTGKLVATTSAQQVTAKNIDGFLHNDRKDSVPVKIDPDPNRALFLTNRLLNDNLVKHYSVFIKGKYDVLPNSASVMKNKMGLQTGLTISNRNLLSIYDLIMYSLYSQRGQQYGESKRIIQIKDTTRITLNKDLDKTDFYTYVCNAPDLKDSSLYEYVLEDLNRYTDYIAKVEKRRVKCLVLKRTSKIDKIKTSGGKRANSLFNTSDSKLVNCSLDLLLMRISELPFIRIPLVNETGYTANADLHLSRQQDLPTLSKELKAYDLELVEGLRELDMFVLKDKK